MTLAISVASIQDKLRSTFQPLVFEVQDHSHKHAGHSGSQAQGPAGGKHLSVTMVSATFEGMPLMHRHRKVYALLAEELKYTIHALDLDLKAPSEVSEASH